VAITPAVVVIAVVALALSEPAEAKGFKRAVLIGSDGRPVTVRGSERAFSGLLSAPGATEPIDGGYVRLFFVGPGEFPAAPARYYPQRSCIALDWPTYERSCRRVDRRAVRRLYPLDRGVWAWFRSNVA
jgi:hypothetical protein